MGLTALVVDDHAMLRQGLRRGLEAEGIRVVAEAADGEAAVRLALEHRPDAVIMDVSMPVVDGIEATRRLMKADGRQRVIILSMHVDRSTVERALKAGAVGYLTKDCSTAEVVEAIRLVTNGDTVISPRLSAMMSSDDGGRDKPVGATPAGMVAGRVHGGARGERPLISAREEEVLQLVIDGLGTSGIAARLYISQKTVKNHLASIYGKLDVRDRTQAVVTAVRMGILRIE
ncbi:MAG: response regulator transcription factor [Ilumatobacteraceae bacterium]